MHPSYHDIISRIGTPPLWYDEHAVPRYCVFEPGRSASIYIGELALVEISCQDCGRKFQVAFSSINCGELPVATAIRAKTLDYGDPPRHDYLDKCVAGDTMNSQPRRVLEYWHRHDKAFVDDRGRASQQYFNWVRDKSLEIDIEPYWVRSR
jgi:hypothetical protein